MAFFTWNGVYCIVQLFQDTCSAGNEICFEHGRNKSEKRKCSGKFLNKIKL